MVTIDVYDIPFRVGGLQFSVDSVEFVGLDFHSLFAFEREKRPIGGTLRIA